MSSFLASWNKLKPSAIKKNVLVCIPLIIILTYMVYILIIQAFTLFLATFLGGLLSFYFIQLQYKNQRKAAHILSVFHIKYLITLSIQSNEKFQLHINANTKLETFPWEPFLNFYDFQALPGINIERINFLHKMEDETHLFEKILAFNAQVTSLTKSLNDLQKYHCLYLDKINNWESKIKTMKAIRDMENRELNLLKLKIGTNLTNQLIFLSSIISKTSNSLKDHGTQLLISLSEQGA